MDLISRSEVLFEKLIFDELMKKKKNWPPFLHRCGSLPCSQGPATGMYSGSVGQKSYRNILVSYIPAYTLFL